MLRYSSVRVSYLTTHMHTLHISSNIHYTFHTNMYTYHTSRTCTLYIPHTHAHSRSCEHTLHISHKHTLHISHKHTLHITQVYAYWLLTSHTYTQSTLLLTFSELRLKNCEGEQFEQWINDHPMERLLEMGTCMKKYYSSSKHLLWNS